ncbi:hypothetical protein EYF80_010309 [Liparis tanakae]|uniref:Uncharacterized protein n=1 Tax=Liparis tanakae TaxID=230148 RepID=A0A4Z2IQQ2_9TELE|nr:hypothetical protein EYF80_010309 [Liparis tanakae]
MPQRDKAARSNTPSEMVRRRLRDCVFLRRVSDSKAECRSVVGSVGVGRMGDYFRVRRLTSVRMRTDKLGPLQRVPSYSSLASGPEDRAHNQQETTGNIQDYADWVCGLLSDTQTYVQTEADLKATEPGRCREKRQQSTPCS